MRDSDLEKDTQSNGLKKRMNSREGTSEVEEDNECRRLTYQNMPFPRRDYPGHPFFPKMGVPPRRPEIFNENASEPAKSLFSEKERYINNSEVKYAVEYIQKVKSHYPDDSIVFANFLEVMKDFKQGRITTEEVAKVISILFKDKDTLISEFKKFLPQDISYMIRYDEDRYEKHKPVDIRSDRMDKDQAVEFVTLAKQRFSDDSEMYTKFIKLLAFLKNKPVPEGKFRELEMLLMDYPDLLSHLHKFIPENAILWENKNSPFNIMNEKLKKKGVYAEFIKCINAFNQDLMSAKDLVFVLRPLLKDENLISELKNYIKYEEVELKNITAKKLKLLKKVGSYSILPEEYKVNYEENNDILNRVCVVCPTHDREDEQYVFLKRNVYEENIFRVEDERFEIDLLINRCDTLILSLESIVERLGDAEEEQELSVGDLDIPLGIVQDVLEFIYGSFGEEVLDGVLNKPKEVVPVVLNRLYLVNKTWRNERAKRNKIWEECIKKNHYKALDSIFCDFKHLNKKSLSYKVLSQNMPGKRMINDLEVFDLIMEVIEIYTENWGINGNNLSKTIRPLVGVLKKENVTFYGNPIIFSVISYFLILYERIKEVKDLDLPKLAFSELATRIGIVQHKDIEDRVFEIFSLLKDFIAGKVETYMYEEEIRILSDGFGYKMLNIDKILSKMDSKIMLLRQGDYNYELLEDIFIEKSTLEKVEMLESSENYKFEIRDHEIEVKKVVCNSYVEVLKRIERFKFLDFEEELIRDKVFLKRNITSFVAGKYYFNLEHRVCSNTMKLRYISGTEDFFMRAGIKRSG